MKLNLKLIGNVLEKHGPSILTGIAAVGVVLTGYLTHKATEKVTMEIALEVERPENDETPIKEIKKKVTKKVFQELYYANNCWSRHHCLRCRRKLLASK